MIDAPSKWPSAAGTADAKIEAQSNTAITAIVVILQLTIVKVLPQLMLAKLGLLKRGASTIPTKTLVGKLMPTASLI